MAMQMLAAGGMAVLTDHQREADEDNPLGYFELERVKHIHEDTGWTEEAKSKAVKVVAPPIPMLPAGSCIG